MTEWDWQKNQNGTHFAERNGTRLSVRRSVGTRGYTAKVNGKFIRMYPTLDLAKEGAEYMAPVGS